MAKPKDYGTLGEFLKANRLGRGLTQKEFAKELGITRNRYTLIETNKVSPGIATANAIAAATKRCPAFIRALIEKTNKEDK